jgi:hypothetical protein
MVARPIARLPDPRLGLTLADDVARVAVALPHAARLLLPVAEMGDVDLRQGNRHQLLAALAHHLALGDVLAQVLLDLAAHDLAEAAVVWSIF